VESLVFRDLTGKKIHQKFSVLDTQMRFSPLEGQCIGEYLPSFDDSATANRLGAMDSRWKNFEFFSSPTHFWKWPQFFFRMWENDTVFTITRSMTVPMYPSNGIWLKFNMTKCRAFL
jgi:hypothetical protein